jgi:hypothetical protein
MLSPGFAPTAQPSRSVGVHRSDDDNQRVTTGEPKLVEICYELRLIPAWFHLNKYIQEDCYEQMESTIQSSYPFRGCQDPHWNPQGHLRPGNTRDAGELLQF